MPDPELNIKVSLNASEAVKGQQQVSKSLSSMSRDFKTIGRDISEVSRTLTFFAGGVTTALGVTFSNAAKDIPQVSTKLKDVSNSFQALSDNIAIAAIPSLNSFSQLINGITVVVTRFVSEHQKFVNEFIKYSGIALAIGVVGIAVAQLYKALSGLVGLGVSIVQFFNATNLAILAVIGSTIALIAAVGWLSDKFLGTHWIDDTINLFKKLGATVSNYFTTFQNGMQQTVERSLDVWGEFTRGVQSNINDLRGNIQQFGASVSSALENSLGEGIFQAITGRIKGLRSILIGFGNDIARAFSQRLANQFLSGLLGDREGGRGLLFGGGFGGFGGIGASFGGRQPAGQRSQATQVREMSDEVQRTTTNLKAFQVTKDNLMQNFVTFGQTMTNVGSGIVASVQSMLQIVGSTIGNLLNFIVQGFQVAISNIISFTQSLFSILSSFGRRGGGFLGGILSFGGAILGNLVAPGIGSLIGGALGGIAGGGGLPSGAGISFGSGAFTKLASGGIVSRPTFALIGESGPEAVVPLRGRKAGGVGGDTNINISIDQAILNNPSNMRDFVRFLKEEMARS